MAFKQFVPTAMNRALEATLAPTNAFVLLSFPISTPSLSPIHLLQAMELVKVPTITDQFDDPLK